MEKIQMVDLRSQYLRIKAEIDEAISEVLNSSAFIQGSAVKQFSKELSDYVGIEHVITCGNGTDALQIAMMALNLKPGDEVLLPVHTYVATAEVIALLGLTPIFIDVHHDTFNIDETKVKEKITNRTRAIVPVHLYGQCSNIEPLLKIALDYGLYVIEDAAQALGAKYLFSSGETKHAGTMGVIGTTSFFPSKNLGCYGDGGAIFTNDSLLAEKISMIANHGQKIKYHHDLVGVNSRLDTLQAAILKVKLKYLDEYTNRRNESANCYDSKLNSIKGVTIPFRSPFSTHVFHQYTLTIDPDQRDDLKMFLERKGIPTMIYYPVPLHMQKAYACENLKDGSFPVTEMLSKSVLSLPIHTEMRTDELGYIANSISEYFVNHGK